MKNSISKLHKLVLITILFACSIISNKIHAQACSSYTAWTPGMFIGPAGYNCGPGGAGGAPYYQIVSYNGRLYTHRGYCSSQGPGGWDFVDIGACTSCTNRTVGAASSSPTLCANSAMTSITHTTSQVTGIASSTGLPTGVSASYSGNVITINGTPSVAGTFNYTITPTSACGTATATGTITVRPILTITLGTNPTITQGTTSVNLPYTANNADQVYVTFNAAAAAAGFTASQNTNLSGVSGNIVLQVPYCPTAGAGTYSGTLHVRTFSPDCISTSYPFSVTIASSPAPTGAAVQSFCSGGTVANLTATGSGIKWYAASTGGAALATSTALVNGNHYYASQTSAGCESTARFDVTVFTATPATPGTITGTAAQCAGLISQTYSVAAVTGATSYNWTVPTGWTITAGTGTNAITVTVGVSGQNGNISVTSTNLCSTSTARTLAATVTASNTVTAASSAPTVCINTALTNITHTTTGATGIQNAGTIGANGLPPGVAASLNNNTITVFGTPSALGTFTYSIPLIGGCGSVNATGTITVSPSVGGTVAGSATVCTGTNSTTLTLSGHTGTITRWESSTSSTFASAVTSIANTTTTLTATNLTATTYYRAVVQAGSCVAANSATGTITFGANTTTPTITAGGATTFCSGGSVVLSAVIPPLDDVAGARLAVGLRKLKASYTGSALRLRRSSDNAEMDFGFVGNDLDVSAISTWLGAASGFCTTLYDQSGNSGNVTQTTVASQPLLVLAGINNKPLLRFTTAQSMNNTVNYAPPYSVVYGTRVIGTSARVLSAQSNNWLLGYWGGAMDQAYFDGWVSSAGSPSTVLNQTNVYAATGTGILSTVYKNGVQLYSNANGVTGPNGIRLNSSGVANEPSNCEFVDVLIYGSALAAANIGKLTTSIVDYYTNPNGTTYLWSNGATTQAITATTAGNYTVQATNTNACQSSSSAAVTVTVSPASVGGTIAGSATVCGTTNSTTLTLSGHTGSIVRWESSASNTFASGVTSIANTTTTLTATNLTATTYYRAVVQAGSCATANSAIGTLTFAEQTAVSLSASSLCVGATTTATALGGWSPASLGTSLALWYDAADVASINQSAGIVSQWNDKSGNGRHLAESNNTYKPTYTANILNGKGGIDFYLNKGLFSTTTPIVGYVASIVKAQNTTWNGYHVMLESRTNATRIGGLWTNGGNSLWSDVFPSLAWQDGNSMSVSGAFNTINSPHIIEYTPAAGRGNPMSGVTVGNFDQQNAGGSGIQYEILALSAAPSVADRERIEGYLAHKWGLTANLPSGHTYKTSSPSIAIAGTWSSSNPAVATINSSGVITAVSAGTCTFTYTTTTTTTTGCSSTTSALTVSPASVGGTVAGSATGCTGTNSTTLTLSGHTGTITRWESSLDNFATAGTSITNATTTLTAINLTATTYYRAVLTSGSCAAANSATATITVSPASVGGSIAGGATVCTGTNSTVLTLSGHTGTIAKWQSSTSSTFASAVTDIVNATTSQTATNLTATTYYRAVITSGSCAVANSATATVTVTPTNTVGAASSTPTLCISTALTNITHTTTGAIGIGTATNLPAGVTAAWAANTITISGTPTASGTFGYSIPLTGGCGTVNATGTITVSPASVGGSLAGSATVCTGTNSTTLTLSGHTGTITRWESSLDNFATSGTTIANTTTTLTATNLTTTTYYRAVLTSGSCAAANSVTGTVTVSPASVGGTVAGSATVCIGTNSTVLTLSGYTGTIIKWQSATDLSFSGNLTNINNTTTSLTATNLTTKTYYRAVVGSGSCPSVNSATAAVTVDVASVGGSISGSATVCAGTNSTILTVSWRTGNITKWQSSTASDFITNLTDIANTTTSLTATDLTTTTYYRAVVSNGSCPSENSTTGTVTVDAVSVGGNISVSAVVCLGTDNTVLTLSGYTGTITKWQSATNSNFSANLTNINNTTTSLTATNLTTTTYYRAVVVNGSCLAANSSTATVTVRPASVGGIVAGSATVCTGTNSTTLTLSGHTGTITRWESSTSSTFASAVTNIANTTTTFTATNLTITTYYRAVLTSGACSSSNSITATVTVSPASAGGTVAGSATVCSGTNSATLTLSGHTGTISRWESSLDNFATAGTSIANTTNTLTASDLTSTTYYRAVVTSGVCASANSTVVTVTVNSCINKWKGSISKDWNTAGNWTQNLVPAVDANIIFDDSPANDCYLDQNRSVTNITNAQGVYGIVLNGNKLTLKGNLVFSGGATIDASASNSTMQFSGSAVQSISTGVFKNAAVYNLVVNNSNNVVLSGNLRLLNNLTATKGLLDAFTNSPTVIYAGNSLQTIEGNQFLEGKIFNLTVDNLIGVNLNTNFTIENTLLINANKIVSVASLYQLTALGTITNNGGVSGLILKSNAIGTASLIHNTDNVPATVQRYISGPTEGWHFLSAPVSNQGISGSWLPVGSYGTGNTATGTGFDLYVWDEPSFSFKYKLDTTPIGWNSVHSGPNFSAGRGYLYSVQAENPTKVFTGNLINGPVSYPITLTETLDIKLIALKGYNLVGNPYPSSVDWRAASGWDRSNLEVNGGGSDMWVWNPTANNYGVFNSASGVGTNSISRYIAPMQAYFVKAASTGNLVFDNSVRVHTGAGNWFKNAAIKNSVIRIAVESEDGNGADEALLQFGYSNSNQGTSKLFSHVTTAPSLYLNVEDKNYSVRYLTNTADINSVPIEFEAGKDGVYKLVFNYDSKELDFIELEDRLLKTATSLKLVNSYQFKSSKKDSASRFVLHFTAPESPSKNALNGLVYMDGSQMAVDLKGINGQTEIKVFDNAGKLILQKYLEGSGLTKLDLNLATQMLLVRLTNAKGASITKVLFNPLKQ